MIQPDGRDSLATRRSYLRRQRGRSFTLAAWAITALCLAWLGVIGLAGLTH